MNSLFLLLAIILPIFAGAISKLIRFRSRRSMEVFFLIPVCITSAVVWTVILRPPTQPLLLLSLARNLTISLRLDAYGSFFAAIVATLWPFATLYAFEYMSIEKNAETFHALYSISYGVTLGVSFASGLLSMYFFYELLTLVTIPLVMFTMTEEAYHAARKYMVFSLGGTAFAFIGLIFIIVYGDSDLFTVGGVLHLDSSDATILMQIVYLFTFFGFGVKSAIYPLHSWLPDAAVAPTPVTALLHAVAVVKSGVFAITRITYFSFGVEFLRGTWAQYVAMCVVIFTILYGSSAAVRERHFKRRLAWSTVANLSYVVFGVLLLTPDGLTGGMLHMLFHAFFKITLFYCAGAVLYRSGREYVAELDGLGRRMPVVFICYTISALSLTGIPPLSGFTSKLLLGTAAIAEGSWSSIVGAVVLLISALLTAIYALYPAFCAFFPRRGTKEPGREISDPNAHMLLPILFTCAVTVAFGLCSDQIREVIYRIAVSMFGGAV